MYTGKKTPAAFCAAALLLALPAQAATLRPMTTLNAPVVLLSDLFDDAGEKAAHVLGPAPPPGERIVVEAPQLAAIARQFGVDWRPASGADRAVLDRPGKLLSREVMFAALRTALLRVGAPEHSDIDLPGYESPLVALEAQPQVTVEQLDYEGASGRFSASVMVSGAQMAPLRMRLSGEVAEIVDIVVPAHRLAAGAVLRDSDFLHISTHAAELRRDVVTDPAQAVGMALRHAMPGGQQIPLAELQRPMMVLKGGHVAMELRAPGMTLVAQGLAQDSGALGEHIQVLNPGSHMVVDGVIVGPDRVVVSQDAVPLPAAGYPVAER